MTLFAPQGDSCAQQQVSLSYHEGLVPSCVSPTTTTSRQQKMMRQRQLALMKQRNLVKNSICAIQQNDLPVLARRLPEYSNALSGLGDSATCAELAAADVAAAAAGANSQAPLDVAQVGDVADRPETATHSISADLGSVSASSTFASASPHAGANSGLANRGVSVAPSSLKSTCWDGPLLRDDMSAEAELDGAAGNIKERPSQGRRFWRPWKSSKRSVTILESQVAPAESPSYISTFVEGGVESIGLDSSLSSTSPGLRCLGRAATPWPAMLGAEEEDGGLGMGPDLPGAMQEQDRPLSRIQLPIKSRQVERQEQESWMMNMPGMQHQHESPDLDLSPSTTGDRFPSQNEAQQMNKHQSSRLRFKSWRKQQMEQQPEEPGSPLPGTGDEANMVSAFEVD